MEWLFEWVFDLLYTLQKSICTIIDFIVEVFRKFAGLETVTIDGKQQDLLSHFLLSSGVKTAFLGVLLVGVILLTIFTIIAILRSETTDGQHKKTKGQMLGKSGQAFLIFVVIPFLIIAGIMLANAIMAAVDQSMSAFATYGAGRSTIGGQILITSGADAFTGNAGEQKLIEQSFANGTFDYNNIETVKKYYDLSKMNFFVGIGSSFVILVMFIIASISFIQRIFDVILLYIISPVSTATIPVDDGGRFRIWREMIISKVLGAYGIVLSMNIFFLIVPQINAINFFQNSFQNGVVSLLFIIGGAFSVTKANTVIAQLTGNSAGVNEAQQTIANMRTSGQMAKMAVVGAGAAFGRVLGGSDFLQNKKRGSTLGDNIASTFSSTRNRQTVSSTAENAKQSSAAWRGITGVSRLATMPVGIVKDLAQGGIVTAGRNFVPRLKNVFNGTTITNRASVNQQLPQNLNMSVPPSAPKNAGASLPSDWVTKSAENNDGGDKK